MSGVVGPWDSAGDPPAMVRRSAASAGPVDRAVTYGLGPRKTRDGSVYLMQQRAWVSLGFKRRSGA